MNLTISPVANPNSAKVVGIAKVTDLRHFDANSSSLGRPTVVRSNEVTNRAITVRTIGRAHGKADIILPEGRTVEMLVQEAVQKALREKGYSVAGDSVPAGTSAIPVEVEIRKFWIWFSPGFWVVTISYEAEIALKGAIVLNGNIETVSGRFHISSPLAVDGMYTGTAEGGNNDLITNTKAKLINP